MSRGQAPKPLSVRDVTLSCHPSNGSFWVAGGCSGDFRCGPSDARVSCRSGGSGRTYCGCGRFNALTSVCTNPKSGSEHQELFFTDSKSRCNSVGDVWSPQCGMLWLHIANDRPADRARARWVEPPSLLLTAPTDSPGHQLMDTLWSLLPAFDDADDVALLYLPADPHCRTWLCHVAQRFFELKARRG